jgi:hypothetical protein
MALADSRRDSSNVKSTKNGLDFDVMVRSLCLQ